jgi:putative Holliday junction resolvase
VRALGIDYGQRRIGLALSDPTCLLARPWKTLVRQGSVAETAATLVDEVARLSAEEGSLATVVLGYPRRLGGEADAQTAQVEALAAMLRARLSIPIILQDERLSSREAESLLARRVKRWRDRKPLLDALSAAVILQDYLDAHPRSVVNVEQDHQ